MSETSFWVRFTLAVLATWRITHLLASEDGPADTIVRLRAALGQSLAGKLMDCFNCLSLWIAAPAALFAARRFVDWLLVWLAVSGAACLLERLGREPAVMEPDSQFSEGDAHHVLRSETRGVQEQFENAQNGSRGLEITCPSSHPSEPVSHCGAKLDAPCWVEYAESADR